MAWRWWVVDNGMVAGGRWWGGVYCVLCGVVVLWCGGVVAVADGDSLRRWRLVARGSTRLLPGRRPTALHASSSPPPSLAASRNLVATAVSQSGRQFVDRLLHMLRFPFQANDPAQELDDAIHQCINVVAIASRRRHDAGLSQAELWDHLDQNMH